MDKPESGPALLRVLATVLGMGQTRLELAGVELAQARQSAIRVVVLAILCTLLLVVASVFASAALVYVLWDVHPLLGFGVVAACYLIAGLYCFRRVKDSVSTFPPLFEATVAELGRDKMAVQEAVKSFTSQSPSQSKSEGETR